MTAEDREDGGPRCRVVPVVWSLALALLVVGPLLGPGYLLLRDAVSTPRSYPTDTALGLGDAAPRAVPQDGLLAAVSTVIDGGFAVKAILVGALWAAGWGAAVLARRLLRVSLGPQLVAATLAIWNPYVAERLLQGHWSLLTGYAALPWAISAARRIRLSHGLSGARPIRAWAALAGWLAIAGLTPTGALLAGLVTLATIGRRGLVGALALWLAACAPWLVATALSAGGAGPSDPAGVTAFAARAEPGLGTLGSLAGLGGIWNGDAVPGSRTTVFALAATIALIAIVLTGVRRVVAAGDPATRRTRRTLLVVAVVAVALPALGATGWGLQFGEWLVARIPGAGLLRDTQKYVALAVPAYTLCAAAGCRAVAAAIGRRAAGVDALPLAATTFIALPLITLPDLAWGVGGALRPVHYPPGWQRVAVAIDGPGEVAALPAGMFRKFPYSGRVPVLDPAPRMLPRDVLQTGELPVRGRVVAGEGTRAREVERILLRGGAPGELAARGVGWVLVERNTPGPLGNSDKTLAQLDSQYLDGDLALYRVPEPADVRTAAGPGHRRLAIAAHLLWALLLLGGPLLWLAGGRVKTVPPVRESAT
ncbi:hypothetical protein NDR87_29110 [Nocardia sp. CDC159]|uniref:Transmembrane protein n=1 Tax=Nocardia pulmonis TaxID=2951408 RepID=A0A9X2EB32_9NOCA|nr:MULTISPECIES: hypothetical protein [Nocardia]MCM6777452.1 hypothetical protein [Nocardia pulmonis]MCM6790441.1 hypothetical protein [Nocardia sp. CDC159]